MVTPEGMQNLEDVRELGADMFLDIDHETNEVFDDALAKFLVTGGSFHHMKKSRNDLRQVRDISKNEGIECRVYFVFMFWVI